LLYFLNDKEKNKKTDIHVFILCLLHLL